MGESAAEVIAEDRTDPGPSRTRRGRVAREGFPPADVADRDRGGGRGPWSRVARSPLAGGMARAARRWPDRWIRAGPPARWSPRPWPRAGAGVGIPYGQMGWRDRRDHRSDLRRGPGNGGAVRAGGRERRPAGARPRRPRGGGEGGRGGGGQSAARCHGRGGCSPGGGRRVGGRTEARPAPRVDQRRHDHRVRAVRSDRACGVPPGHGGHLPGHRIRDHGGHAPDAAP